MLKGYLISDYNINVLPLLKNKTSIKLRKRVC